MPNDIGWLALCGGLTALGVVIAFLTMRRRGAASGLRMLGWAVLPIAAYLTGVVSLLWTLGERIAHWAGGIIFNTTVQVGTGLFGLGIVLIIVGTIWRGRGGAAVEGGKPAKAAGGGEQPRQQAAASKQQPSKQVGAGGGDNPLEGMEDIEEILKRRGIGDK